MVRVCVSGVGVSRLGGRGGEREWGKEKNGEGPASGQISPAGPPPPRRAPLPPPSQRHCACAIANRGASGDGGRAQGGGVGATRPTPANRSGSYANRPAPSAARHAPAAPGKRCVQAQSGQGGRCLGAAHLGKSGGVWVGSVFFFSLRFFFDADPLATPRSFFTPATPPPRLSPPLSPPTMSSALRATPARVAGTNKVGGQAGVWSRRGSACFCPLLLLAVARGGHRAASHARHLVNLAIFLQKGVPSRGGVGGGAEWRRALNRQTPSSPAPAVGGPPPTVLARALVPDVARTVDASWRVAGRGWGGAAG